MGEAGLDEALQREAEARRQRQPRRGDDSWDWAQAQPRKSQLSRASRLRIQGRLERELLAAFEDVCGRGELSVPPEHLGEILEKLGLLNGAEDDAFAARLGRALAAESHGIHGDDLVSFECLLAFLAGTLHREGGHDHAGARHGRDSLEECCDHLERKLVGTRGHAASRSSSQPRAEACRRGAEPAAGSASPFGGAARTPPRAWPREADAGALEPDTGIAQPSRHFPALSRCEMLYHQAVYASHRNAQLEEETRLSKQEEEMRECTFTPNIHPARRRKEPKVQPRNFESAVARMRAAHRRHVQHREECEHIPHGENYERLRRLYLKDRSCPRPPPLVYVDVDVGRGRVGRIEVHEDDNLHRAAQSFARSFRLSSEAAQKLEVMLHQAYEEQMQALCFAEATQDAGLAPQADPTDRDPAEDSRWSEFMEQEAMMEKS
mmetsp:Transcript_101116/g.286609  ORF Transcript_101116/g.286609 Transcript_101116/m.286609 type:complete len:436 (-) Transcript_101116:119-1426(-)